MNLNFRTQAAIIVALRARINECLRLNMDPMEWVVARANFQRAMLEELAEECPVHIEPVDAQAHRRAS
jgi:hypothetical protein